MEKLGVLTARELRTRMTQADFVRWTVYYGRKRQKEQLARGRKR